MMGPRNIISSTLRGIVKINLNHQIAPQVRITPKALYVNCFSTGRLTATTHTVSDTITMSKGDTASTTALSVSAGQSNVSNRVNILNPSNLTSILPTTSQPYDDSHGSPTGGTCLLVESQQWGDTLFVRTCTKDKRMVVCQDIIMPQ